MKIFKVSDVYPEYLRYIYEKYPRMKNMSFEYQRQYFFADTFSDMSWTPNIVGSDVEIFETILNCEHLQRSWNKDFDYGDSWQLNILIDQIVKTQPDICYFYPPEYFTQELISFIKQEVKIDFLVLGYDGTLRQNLNDFIGYDLIITCSKFISDFYQKSNIKSYDLEFGFDESILPRIQNIGIKNDICFSGSIYKNIHNARYDLLKYFVAKNSNIEIFTEQGDHISKRIFKKRNISRLMTNWDIKNFITEFKIARLNHGQVFGIEMYQKYRESKVSLNMHGDKIDFAANIRLFEITGSGSCLLTDWKKNLADIFIPDKEVITYNSKEEAYDKSRFLLKNENFRKRIANAGQKRTLSQYTLKRRMASFINYLQQDFM